MYSSRSAADLSLARKTTVTAPWYHRPRSPPTQTPCTATGRSTYRLLVRDLLKRTGSGSPAISRCGSRGDASGPRAGNHGNVAHLEERRVRSAKAAGSSPSASALTFGHHRVPYNALRASRGAGQQVALARWAVSGVRTCPLRHTVCACSTGPWVDASTKRSTISACSWQLGSGQLMNSTVVSTVAVWLTGSSIATGDRDCLGDQCTVLDDARTVAAGLAGPPPASRSTHLNTLGGAKLVGIEAVCALGE
jgi:hypothetical protein